MDENCKGCTAKEDEIKHLREEIKDWKNRFLAFMPEAMSQYKAMNVQTFVPTVIDANGEIKQVDTEDTETKDEEVDLLNTVFGANSAY